MNSGLRKAHRYIWLILAILVPVIMVLSISDLSYSSHEKEVNTSLKSSTTAPIKTAENELIKASIHTNSIEIILKSSLKNPSSVVYSLDTNGTKQEVLGQLTTTGIYTFKIDKLPIGILVFDALKNSEITKLQF